MSDPVFLSRYLYLSHARRDTGETKVDIHALPGTITWKHVTPEISLSRGLMRCETTVAAGGLVLA